MSETEEPVNADTTTLVTISLALIAMSLFKLDNIIANLFRAVMGIMIGGALLRLLPVDFLQDWSRQAIAQTNIALSAVPLLCALGVYLVLQGSMPFADKTGTVGKVMLGLLFVIGGTTSVGAAGWGTLSTSIGETLMGLLKTIGAFMVVITAGLVKFN